jgi:TolB-like protein/Tfp pilus assembly protein PilF
MPDNPNRLSQFWQELKRRKVVRVITVYAATAFVILELVDIITEPLRLPEWTLQFAIVFLCIGFIIAVIFSWIYDVKPEGGLEKTQPAHKVIEEDIPKSSNSWKIASYISFVVIVALIVLNVVPRTNRAKEAEIFEKSIAVLPFTSLSDDPEKQYLADGVMDAILLHLSKIEDLRVMSRTSVEQYRVTEKKATEICQELDVTFVLEGSFRKYGDQARLIVQLIQSGKEDHAWANQYDREWKDIFTVESEVAQSIAQELKAVITFDEKELIEKKHTENLDAYDFYLLGQNYAKDSSRDDNIWKTIDYYQQAIALDSTYALAYSGIAGVYLLLVNLAIISPIEGFTKAKAYAMKALELNQDLENAHYQLGTVYQDYEYDFTAAESEYIRALDINPNSHTAHLSYAYFLSSMGRHDEALSHADIALKLDPLKSRSAKNNILFNAGYKSEALVLAEELRESYPNNPYNYWWCAVFYIELGRYEEALSMLDTQLALMGDDNISDDIGLQGFIYGRLDQKDEALKQQARLDELSLKGYYVSPRTRVWIYLGLDNLDEAFAVLEKAYNDHSIDPLSFILYFYPIESLQSDPRFKDYLQKIGLNN